MPAPHIPICIGPEQAWHVVQLYVGDDVDGWTARGRDRFIGAEEYRTAWFEVERGTESLVG